LNRDPAFEEWIEEARAMPIGKALDIVAPHHAISRRTRFVGPCPGCGGTDRFSLNLKKNIFWCRKSAGPPRPGGRVPRRRRDPYRQAAAGENDIR
jgi:hypothetical protein